MSKRKERFTPGPWKPGLNKAFSTVLDGYEGKAIYPAKGNNHIAWANIAKGNGHIDMERAVANARLIAAAPDMYSLLKEMLSSDRCNIAYFKISVENVLKKARGEEQDEW